MLYRWRIELQKFTGALFFNWDVEMYNAVGVFTFLLLVGQVGLNHVIELITRRFSSLIIISY